MSHLSNLFTGRKINIVVYTLLYKNESNNGTIEIANLAKGVR